MKRFFLLLLVLVLFTGTAAAEDAEVLTSGDYLYTILEDGTVCVNGYWGGASELTIPAEIDGKIVTAIGDAAFLDYGSLTTVTIPDSVASIGGAAFLNCRSLTEITIPDSVTSIGDWAFFRCDNLTAITIPDNVREVGANPFVGTPASIRVSPEHPYLAVIDGVLFEKENKRLISYPYGSELSEYAIPQGILQIGYEAFLSCDSLTAVTIPDSVTSIGENAFYGCNGLTAITIPGSVTSIGNSAFFGCNSLTEITIPDSVTSVGDDAFSYCESLTAITIPDSVQEIGINPFLNTSVAIQVSPEHPYLAVIDGVLFEKESKRLISYPCGSNLSEYVIPQGIQHISDWAFYRCESLTAVTIPDSVISIGNRAFSNCENLTAVTIPDSVTAIGISAFDGCDSLTLTVERDSYAAQYCKDNNLLYQYTN